MDEDGGCLGVAGFDIVHDETCSYLFYLEDGYIRLLNVSDKQVRTAHTNLKLVYIIFHFSIFPLGNASFSKSDIKNVRRHGQTFFGALLLHMPIY